MPFDTADVQLEIFTVYRVETVGAADLLIKWTMADAEVHRRRADYRPVSGYYRPTPGKAERPFSGDAISGLKARTDLYLKTLCSVRRLTRWASRYSLCDLCRRYQKRHCLLLKNRFAIAYGQE